MKRWKLQCSVYRGDGQTDYEEEVIEAATEAEAAESLWDMLGNMHVTSSVEEVDEKGEPV
jgi:hypothetical protein